MRAPDRKHAMLIAFSPKPEQPPTRPASMRTSPTPLSMPLRHPGYLLVLALFMAGTSVRMGTAVAEVSEDAGQSRVSPAGLAAILKTPLRPPPLGNPAGDVTVVEYFDYNCPTCRQSAPALEELLARDSRVRLIFKDWPIFGAVSAYAAYCSFAAAELGQYQTAHQALIGSRDRLGSNDQVDSALREAGLDVAALRALIQQHQRDYSATLSRNEAEANALGLPGTPGFLIGDQLIARGLTADRLRQLVDRARQGAPLAAKIAATHMPH